MAPPAKGLGKGSASNTETWEQKHTRLKKEITEAAKQSEDLTFLNKIFQAHLTSTRLTFTKPQASAQAAKPKAKPKAGSFSASNAANNKVVQTQKQLDEAARLATEARDARLAESEERARVIAERNAKKKEEREAQRVAGGPRPTQFCPRCTYAGTYATSLKCHHCKVAFAAPRAPTPSPAASATPSTPSTFLAAATATLASITARPCSITLVNGSLQATPPAQTLPAATPLSVLAPAAPVGVGAPLAQVQPVPQLLQGAATLAAPPATAPVTAPTATAAPPLLDSDLEEVRQLTALQAEKAEVDKQAEAFKKAPAVRAALVTCAAELQVKITALMGKRQLALQPHQLGVLLSQRQLDLSTAQETFAKLDAAAKAQMLTHDDATKALDDGFTMEILRVTEAQKAARDGCALERTSLYDSLKLGLETATQACRDAQSLLRDAEAAHSTQSGATKAAAEAAAAIAVTNAAAQTAAADAATAAAAAAQQRVIQEAADAATAQRLAAATANQSLQLQHEETQRRLVSEATAKHQDLQRQLDAQQQILDQQTQQLVDQQAVLHPAAVKPMAVLPPPPAPKDTETGVAWFRLRQFLALVAQQDIPLLVTWADVEASQVDWPTFLTLVPLDVVHEALPHLGTDIPDGLTPVPRRLVACLRDQMDALAHQWLTEQAKAASRAEVIASANEYAAKTLDQARRLQDRKRPAEVAPPAKEQRLSHQQKCDAVSADSTDPSSASTASAAQPA